MCTLRHARFLVPVFSVFALLFLAGPVQSQEVTAAINGVITDPSGAAVPGVNSDG